MYLDPAPIDAMTASKEEKNAHTLALLADAEQALTRVCMEGTFMTDMLVGDVHRVLLTVQAAQQPNTAVGVGLHPIDRECDRLNALTYQPARGFTLPKCVVPNCPWPAYTGDTCDTHKDY